MAKYVDKTMKPKDTAAMALMNCKCAVHENKHKKKKRAKQKQAMLKEMRNSSPFLFV